MANTYEATQIEITEEVTQLDEHAKRILGSKTFLSWIIKGTVKEVTEYTPDEIFQMIEGDPQIGIVPVDPGASNNPAITGSNTEDKVPYEGLIRYDVLTHIRIPGDIHTIKILINVEGQKKSSSGYDLVTRGVYYGARRISAQNGTEFANSNYDDIKKVYSIWICFDSKEDERNTITEYSIRKKNIYGEMPDRERYDLMSVVFVRLGGDLEAYDESTLQAMLMVLFSQRMTAGEKKRILSDRYGIRMSEEDSKEVEVMCNYGEGVFEQGFEQGNLEKAVTVVDNLLANGFSESEACEIADITFDEYRKFKDSF